MGKRLRLEDGREQEQSAKARGSDMARGLTGISMPASGGNG